MGRSAVVRVGFLTLSGDPLRWQRLGFAVDAGGVIRFLDTSIRLIDERRRSDDAQGSDGAERADTTKSGLLGWELTGDVMSSGATSDIIDIDGLATRVVAAEPPQLVEHDNGASGLDHVVVVTGSLERTSAAIERATAAPLKRIRELEQMRQGFHRLGDGGLIVEIVERPELTEEPTSMFWGFVVNVADLDAAVAMIGPDLIGPAKSAVQPGRQIATVRREAGLGVPLAFMSQ